jgi:class 3 adenylate cyclase
MATRPRILIVDDESYNVDYLEQELEELDYETISASNGVEALTRIQIDRPDLVLLDIMMPIMDGFAVLQRTKADPVLREVPIIVISAMNDLDSVVKGIRLGAEDYLPKPFEPTLLQARIASSLEKKRLRDQQRRLLHTFTSKEVAETLVAEGFSLGGKRIDASIMFTDIRSFTTISEGKDPAETIDLLNRYFAVVFEPISRYGGIVNQIIGDGMMALFGITRRSVVSASNVDHRQHAVQAAIAILDALHHFNAQQGAANQTQIEIGIGIASGSVIAGYAGTQHRATYTCVGDTVNRAARIEEHTKVLRRPILFDAETRAGLSHGIAVEPLGEVLFRGKTVPVELHTVGAARGEEPQPDRGPR